MALTGFWVTKNLEHYAMDSSLGGGQTIYGSGYLLKLDSNGQVASLGADFRWEKDSLYQGGEPGMTLKIGEWNQKGQSLLLSQQLVSKTFLLSGERIGQLEADSVFVQSDSTLIHGQDTLIFVKKPSKELVEFVKRIVTFHKSKNGS